MVFVSLPRFIGILVCSAVALRIADNEDSESGPRRGEGRLAGQELQQSAEDSESGPRRGEGRLAGQELQQLAEEAPAAPAADAPEPGIVEQPAPYLPALSLASKSQSARRDEDNTCCCWEGLCTYEQDKQTERSVAGYMNKLVNESLYGSAGNKLVHSCCFHYDDLKIYESSCPSDAGAGSTWINNKWCAYDTWEASQTTMVPSSFQGCADYLTWWFGRGDWDVVLEDHSTRDARTAEKYDNYVACLVGKDTHVRDVVLGATNYFKGLGRNPVKPWVMSRQECRSLTERDVVRAIERSFDDMCAWPLIEESYSPDLNPGLACSYNHSASRIEFSPNTRCPEGHRCACPSNGKNLEAADPREPAPTGLRKWLSRLTQGFRNSLTSYITIGTLASVVHAVWAWPLVLTVGAPTLLVFGTQSMVEWLTYSCQANVGCFPMPCVLEEGVGCRMSLDTDELDYRNPYWFMPPPMYKCSVNPTWGSCQLSACTADDAKLQMVGEHTAEYGLFRKKPRSTVANCQPTLAQDMSFVSLHKFDTAVSALAKSEHQLSRRTTVLERQRFTYCPYAETSGLNSKVICWDGSECHQSAADGSCCTMNLGIRQCSNTFPNFCVDGSCDTPSGKCRGDGKGGIKVCLADDRCPWLLPTLVDDTIECGNGEQFLTSHFTDMNQPWCHHNAGLRRCPWNAPIRCESTECEGGYCCAKACDNFGGPKLCDSVTLNDPLMLRSWAQDRGPHSWSLLACAAVVLCLAARVQLPH